MVCETILCVHCGSDCLRLAEGRARFGGNPTCKHMLTGLLRCPMCRKTMVGHRRIRERQVVHELHTSVDHYYHCPDSRPSQNSAGIVCNPKTCNRLVAETLVVKAAARPELLRVALTAYREEGPGGFSEEDSKRVETRI